MPRQPRCAVILRTEGASQKRHPDECLSTLAALGPEMGVTSLRRELRIVENCLLLEGGAVITFAHWDRPMLHLWKSHLIRNSYIEFLGFSSNRSL